MKRRPPRSPLFPTTPLSRSLARRSRRDAPFGHQVMIGAARESLVPRQHVGLAAEAADALDAADEARARLRLDATQLTGGRTRLDEPRQLLVDRPLHAGEIAARLRGCANHELPA